VRFDLWWGDEGPALWCDAPVGGDPAPRACGLPRVAWARPWRSSCSTGRMLRVPRSFVLFATLLWTGCSSGSAADGADRALDEGALRQSESGVCFPGDPGECTRVPKFDAPTGSWVDDKCFYWNRKSSDRASKVYKVVKRSRSTDLDELTLKQLRAALRYFQREDATDSTAKLEDLSVDELFELAEDPIFYVLEDRVTHARYRRINFAAGDNPMDVIYADGTLQPVAMVEDDSVFFCDAAHRGR
jgi:hypothetical protein